MGNKSCILGVQTEKNVYFGGDTVNGRVYLSVNDRNGIVAQTLNIHCSGLERCKVHYCTERQDGSRTFHDDSYEEKEVSILNFDVPINTPIGSLYQQGQYEFPFNFVIPQNLPSSMFCQQGQSKCEIRYEIRAYLRKNERTPIMNPFSSNRISSRPLQLNIFGGNNTVSHRVNQTVHFPGYNHSVRTCCCFGRGKMDLRASMDSDLFVPNDNRTLSFDLKNNSRVGVDSVVVEVMEEVRWKPGFREECFRTPLIRYEMDGSADGDWMSTEQTTETGGQEYTRLSPSGRMSDATKDVNLRIPHSSRDTYNGRIIQVKHFVRVKVVTQGCCVSNPETTLDINIMRPSQMFSSSDVPPPFPSAPMADEKESIPEATALPSNWSPLTSSLFTVPVANVISVSHEGEFGENQTASPLPEPSAPMMNK